MTLYLLRLKALLCIVKCSCYCSGFMSELKHSKQASCYSCFISSVGHVTLKK